VNTVALGKVNFYVSSKQALLTAVPQFYSDVCGEATEKDPLFGEHVHP
jgi:hypothetical protein